MATKKTEVNFGWKKATLDDMMNYIGTNAPEDKEWFKKIAFEKQVKNKKGEITGYELNLGKDGKKKYNHINARYQFFDRYAPELMPKKKEKEKASDLLENW